MITRHRPESSYHAYIKQGVDGWTLYLWDRRCTCEMYKGFPTMEAVILWLPFLWRR